MRTYCRAMAAHSSALAWKIPWTEEPGGLQSMGSLRVGHEWMTSISLFLSCTGEGKGSPLQCSCLENPRDRGACWAAVSAVARSWTRLKRLSSSTVEHRELYSVLCSDVTGKEIQKKRGYMCVYSWSTLLYSRNRHNIVKQLYTNKN